jgi:aminoacrylate hydrolase
MPYAARLWYEWHGPEAGEVLILSPGLGGSGSYWQPNLPALSEHYRVLLYDHRGTGRSDRALPGRVSVEEMAGDVIALMDSLGIARAHLLGHAAGAAIGLVLALDSPERLDRLVLVNGWSRPDPHFERCFDVRLALLRGGGPEAWVRAQPIFLYPAPWSSANSARIEAEEKVHLAHFPGAETIERRVAALRAFDVDARLGEIGVPVLALAADDDLLVPAPCSLRLAERIPGAAHHAMRRGGHGCNVTDPDEFNQIVLGWLGQAHSPERSH